MSTLTKNERQALDELFLAMQERRNFLMRLQNSRKEMIRILKTLFTKQKIPTNY
jgi:hypothetical protein